MHEQDFSFVPARRAEGGILNAPYVGDVITCPHCGLPYPMAGVLLMPVCQCLVRATVTTTSASSGTVWIQGPPNTTGIVSIPSVFGTEEEDDEPPEEEWVTLMDEPECMPALRADAPTMKERAERVLAQRIHKDVSGETAHQMAKDVLLLLEAFGL